MKSDPNTIIQYIEQVKSTGIDKLRIQFKATDADKITLLRNYYRNRRDIVLENVTERAKTDIIQNKLDQMDEEERKMVNALSDPNISPQDKLIIYMNKKNGNSFWTAELFEKFMEDLKRL